MGDRGVKVTLSLDPRDKVNLERMAVRLGFIRGSSPNISALIRAIAQGGLQVNQPKENIAKAIAIIEEQLKEIKPYG